jgi:hypothetical protein
MRQLTGFALLDNPLGLMPPGLAVGQQPNVAGADAISLCLSLSLSLSLSLCRPLCYLLLHMCTDSPRITHQLLPS